MTTAPPTAKIAARPPSRIHFSSPIRAGAVSTVDDGPESRPFTSSGAPEFEASDGGGAGPDMPTPNPAPAFMESLEKTLKPCSWPAGLKPVLESCIEGGITRSVRWLSLGGDSLICSLLRQYG